MSQALADRFMLENNCFPMKLGVFLWGKHVRKVGMTRDAIAITARSRLGTARRPSAAAAPMPARARRFCASPASPRPGQVNRARIRRSRIDVARMAATETAVAMTLVPKARSVRNSCLTRGRPARQRDEA